MLDGNRKLMFSPSSEHADDDLVQLSYPMGNKTDELQTFLTEKMPPKGIRSEN